MSTLEDDFNAAILRDASAVQVLKTRLKDATDHRNNTVLQASQIGLSVKQISAASKGILGEGAVRIILRDGRPCRKQYPEVGHEDEGYSCTTHNMPWGECHQ